jgi:5,10-methenyltetrahydrofolate synthetase
MTPAPTADRAQLRRQLRQARRALSDAQQRQAALGLYRQLAQHPLFRRARHIALYLPNDGEIDPCLLLAEAQRRGKCIYLPVLSAWPRTKMVFQRVRPGECFRPNRFRIPEPRGCAARQRAVWALDLVLMPLVGFDAAVDAWAWGVASTTVAWPTVLAGRRGENPCCWGWRTNARRYRDWRRPVGTYPCKPRYRTRPGTWLKRQRLVVEMTTCGAGSLFWLQRLCAYPVVTTPRPSRKTNTHSKSGLRRIDTTLLKCTNGVDNGYTGGPSSNV